MRLPIVMAVANRALSSPLSIWCDHSDMMSVRDTGWIQIIAENGQAAVDNTICGFRISENHDVLLPSMVHLDGFTLTHVIEPIIFPEQADVDRFLPRNAFPLPLDPDKPVAMGDFAAPAVFMEAKWALENAIRDAKKHILATWDEFGRVFGRQYHPIEKYQTEGAKILLVTMGSAGETASVAVDEMRKEGMSVGQLRLRLWRPFPFEELREAVEDADVVVVMDRAISFGGPGGPLASEIKTALYDEKKRPAVVPFVISLGGRDTTVSGFKDIVRQALTIAEKGSPNEYEIYGVRE
jgi:pyruvate ferredoxin oxidoreductase alpha subunit